MSSRSKRPLLSRPLVILLLAGICAVALYSLYGMYKKYRTATGTREAHVRERDALEKQRLDLLTSIENLDSERGREEEIRSRFRAIKPGESLIVIVDEEGNEIVDKPEERPFLKRLWKNLTCLFSSKC